MEIYTYKQEIYTQWYNVISLAIDSIYRITNHPGHFTVLVYIETSLAFIMIDLQTKTVRCVLVDKISPKELAAIAYISPY